VTISVDLGVSMTWIPSMAVKVTYLPYDTHFWWQRARIAAQKCGAVVLRPHLLPYHHNYLPMWYYDNITFYSLGHYV
jgi:hypothetical protein